MVPDAAPARSPSAPGAAGRGQASSDDAPAGAAPAPWPAEAGYLAMRTRDGRFDGRLFVGVTSTGVYCRPVCRVKPPRRENCRFFHHAAQAEAAGFRPCLRCRPELAPGLSLTDSPQVLAAQAARWLDQAVMAGEPVALPALAARLGITDRHLRRIFLRAHGVTPLAWLSTRRLLLAKQLLTDTGLPITEVALASGFGSLRRFQQAFATHYRLQPSRLRRERALADPPAPASDGVAAAGAPVGATLPLGFRPPYDVAGVGRFLARRALAGVEQVQADAGGFTWTRTLALEHQGHRLRGWLRVGIGAGDAVARLTLSPDLLPAAGGLLLRCRRALDLDADPGRIAAGLASLPGEPRPGLRIPGAWDGWESAVRVILGQQVSVAAACTLTARLVAAFGEPIATPWPWLERCFPEPLAIATAEPDRIGRLGIVRQRVRALQALARAMAGLPPEGGGPAIGTAGDEWTPGAVADRAAPLRLDPQAPLDATLQALQALPGIGPWTAQLIAMRALAWPDAWLPTDLGVLQALGTRDPAEATARVEACRPWRAYAVMHLWLALGAEAAPPAATATVPGGEPDPAPNQPAPAPAPAPTATPAPGLAAASPPAPAAPAAADRPRPRRRPRTR